MLQQITVLGDARPLVLQPGPARADLTSGRSAVQIELQFDPGKRVVISGGP
jgi:hypothetical protein